MPLPSSPSPDEHDRLLQRFLVASRRGEIVAQINAARSEDDLGAVVATELCEAYDAEVGFVLITRPGSTTPELIGCVGLIGNDRATVLAQPLCREALASAMAVTEQGTSLLGLGIRNLALAAHTAGGARLLVGVGRLHDQHFEKMELALLEAVTKSTAHALERFGLEHQLQRAHELETAARLGGGIAHEFHRTLERIIGQCDLGTDSLDRGASEVGTDLREIRATAESAAELVQPLLAYSRPQVPEPAAFDGHTIESQTPAELSLPSLPDLGSLADLFRRLGHPIRLQILLALGSDTMSPSELEERLEVGLALLAYHVRFLRDDGFLMLVETRPIRGALESFYRLTGRGQLARNILAATWREMSDVAEHP